MRHDSVDRHRARLGVVYVDEVATSNTGQTGERLSTGAEKVGPDKHASWEGLPTRCAELAAWRADVQTFTPSPHRLEFSHGIVDAPADAGEIFCENFSRATFEW